MRRFVWRLISQRVQGIESALEDFAAAHFSVRALATESGSMKFIDESFFDKKRPNEREQFTKMKRGKAADWHTYGVSKRTNEASDTSSSIKSIQIDREHMYLTRAIKECASPHHLIGVIEQQAAYLNPTNISAATTHLTHMVSKLSMHPRVNQDRTSDDPGPAPLIKEQCVIQATLTLLARCTEHQIESFQARQLANCSWGIAKLSNIGAITVISATSFLSTLLYQANRPGVLNGALPEELSALTWSMYITHYHDHDLLDKITQAALMQPLEAYTDQDIINVLVLTAAAKCPQPKLFDALCLDMLGSGGQLEGGRLEGMVARHVHKLAFACSATQYHCDNLTQGIAARSRQILGQFRTEQLSGLLSTMVSLKCRDQLFYQNASEVIGKALQEGSLTHPLFVSKLMSDVALVHGFDSAWSNSLMERAHPILKKCRTVKDTARAAVAFTVWVASRHEETIARELLGLISRLGPVLGKMDVELLTWLIVQLPAALPRLIKIPQIVDGRKPGEVVSSSDEIMREYVSVLRSVALSRIGEFGKIERIEVLRSLLHLSEAASLHKDSSEALQAIGS